MNEKMPNFTHKREEMVKPYSELSESLKEGDWGVAFNEKTKDFIRVYADPELIKEVFTQEIISWLQENRIDKDDSLQLVDFGGGDGILIDTITKQLQEEGYKQIIGTNLDFTRKNLLKMKENYLPDDSLSAVQGNILEIPIKANSVDIGISRYMLQYLGKDQQEKALREMLNSLKPNGRLIMQLPVVGETIEQALLISEFHNKINAVLTGESFEEAAENKYYPSIEDIRKMADDLEVECTVSSNSNIKALISAESYFDRFSITDDDQREKIREIFGDSDLREKADEIGGLNFIEKNGNIYVETPDAKIIFEK